MNKRVLIHLSFLLFACHSPDTEQKQQFAKKQFEPRAAAFLGSGADIYFLSEKKQGEKPLALLWSPRQNELRLQSDSLPWSWPKAYESTDRQFVLLCENHCTNFQYGKTGIEYLSQVQKTIGPARLHKRHKDEHELCISCFIASQKQSFFLGQALDSARDLRFFRAYKQYLKTEHSPKTTHIEGYALRKKQELLYMESYQDGAFLIDLARKAYMPLTKGIEAYTHPAWPLDSSKALYQPKQLIQKLYYTQYAALEKGLLSLQLVPTQSQVQGLRFFYADSLTFFSLGQCKHWILEDTKEPLFSLACQNYEEQNWQPLALQALAQEQEPIYILLRHRGERDKHALYRIEGARLVLKYSFRSKAKTWVASHNLKSRMICFSSPENSETLVLDLNASEQIYHLLFL